MLNRRTLLLILLSASPTFAQVSFRTIGTRIFGGSGTESISAIALDNAGNILVAGTTSSFDFPTLNAFQTANPGVPLMFSPDAGITWKPVPDQSVVGPSAIAVDPTDPNTVYIGASDRVYKSTDSGQHFTFADLPLATFPFGTVQSSVQELAVDPHNPQVIYSVRSQNGVAKSTDGGQTWTLANTGLQSTGGNTIRIDPFHADTVIVWEAGQPYRTTDGGKTWAQIPVPGTCCFSGTGIGVTFDPFTPDVLYGSAPGDIYKSTDGGQSWVPLHVPFPGIIRFATDPSTKNTLYAEVEGSASNNGIWKTEDGGATWRRLGFQQQSQLGPPSVDPANPKILLIGAYRSDDGGLSLRPTTLSRFATATFAADGRVFAIVPTTSDAFVRKYDPGGTVVFSTYLGGQGNDSASAIAVDAAGSAYVTGSTSSVDFPVTPGTFQTQIQGQRDSFVAKIAPDGSLLYATYLGGTGNDDAAGIAVDSNGSAVIVGSTNSTDFPGSANSLPAFQPHAFVARLSPDGTSLVYGTTIGGQFADSASAVALDAQNNAIVTGQTTSSDFPLTASLFASVPSTFQGSRVFVTRLSPTGQVLYSTYFGGIVSASSDESPNSTASGIALDASGNIYVGGYTSAKDFPITAGAFQPNIHATCPYPSSAIATGFIGTIFRFFMDDFFLTKISADGSKPLFSTFLGGNCFDTASSIAVDTAGNAWIAGNSDSSPFPLLFPIEEPPTYSNYKGVVSGISADGASLLFSSYTSAGPHPVLAMGADGSLFIAGSTATQSAAGLTPGNNHAYVTKLVRTAPPRFSLNSVVNNFSQLSGPIAPGEIVSLLLANFDPGTSIDVGLVPQQALDTQLGGTRVLFDGQPAYLLKVSPGQIVCFAPSSLSGEPSTQIQVDFRGQLSNTITVNVNPTAVGLLSADGSGTGLANVRNEDGSLNSALNPAARGSRITLFFTGAGITNPPQPDGVVVTDSNAQPVATFRIGNSPIEFIGSLPGFVPGIFQIVTRVPTQPTGNTQFNAVISTTTSSSQILSYYVTPN